MTIYWWSVWQHLQRFASLMNMCSKRVYEHIIFTDCNICSDTSLTMTALSERRWLSFGIALVICLLFFTDSLVYWNTWTLSERPCQFARSCEICPHDWRYNLIKFIKKGFPMSLFCFFLHFESVFIIVVLSDGFWQPSCEDFYFGGFYLSTIWESWKQCRVAAVERLSMLRYSVGYVRMSDHLRSAIRRDGNLPPQKLLISLYISLYLTWYFKKGQIFKGIYTNRKAFINRDQTG